MEQFTFLCISCSVVMVEERGEYSCPHCGGNMEEEEEDEESHEDKEEGYA